jgi:hypothetical protein
MIKAIFLFLIFSLSSFGASNTPSSTSGSERGIDLRVMKKEGRKIFVFETKNREELLDESYHQALIGSYYRVTKRLRVGLFLQTEQGLRWDDDWVKSESWQWERINNRWDYSTVFDLSYQDKINSKFLWELKNRLAYYHSRDALLLKLRPGLRYFIFKNGSPWAQIFTQVETYIPVNYGHHLIYEYWAYLGSLFEVTKGFSMGPLISYRQRWFHSYDSFKETTNLSYRTQLSSFYYGLSALFQF